MEKWPDDILELPNNRGKKYLWCLEYDDVIYGMCTVTAYQHNDDAILFLVEDVDGELAIPDFGMDKNSWLKLHNIQLLK